MARESIVVIRVGVLGLSIAISLQERLSVYSIIVIATKLSIDLLYIVDYAYYMNRRLLSTDFSFNAIARRRVVASYDDSEDNKGDYCKLAYHSKGVEMFL